MSRSPMVSGSFFLSVTFFLAEVVWSCGAGVVWSCCAEVAWSGCAGAVWSCLAGVVWSGGPVVAGFCANTPKENRLSAARIAAGVLHGWLIVRDSCIATLYALSLRSVSPMY